MMSRLVLPALALLAMPVAAQTVLQPGSDVLVDAPVASTEYVVQMVAPAPQDIGTLTSTEALIDGQLVMTSHMVVAMGGVDTRDSLVVAWPSLTPLSATQTEPDGVTELAFADGRASGTAMKGDVSMEIDTEITAADFGPGIAARIAQSLPFEDGYAATFSQIDGDGNREEVALTVTGRETLAHNGAERSVWVIDEMLSGQPRFTYHVDAETRDMLQMVIAPQPGVLIHVTAR